MKKYHIAFALLFCTFMLASTSIGIAQETIQVILNGQPVQFEVAPQVVDNRVLVPIRFVADNLGGTAVWDQKARSVVVTTNGHTMTMWPERQTMLLDGKNIGLDVAPQTIAGRVFIPLRTISTVFNVDVEWQQASNRVIIKDKIAEPALSLSTNSMQLMTGESKTVTVTKPKNKELSFWVSNSNIATCQWGSETNGKMPLIITGLTPGTTNIEVSAKDSTKISTIRVKVTDDPNKPIEVIYSPPNVVKAPVTDEWYYSDNNKNQNSDENPNKPANGNNALKDDRYHMSDAEKEKMDKEVDKINSESAIFRITQEIARQEEIKLNIQQQELATHQIFIDRKERDIAKAQEELSQAKNGVEKAKKVKKLVYRTGQGWVYEMDTSKVAEAQENVDYYLEELTYYQESLEILNIQLQVIEKKISAVDNKIENLNRELAMHEHLLNN